MVLPMVQVEAFDVERNTWQDTHKSLQAQLEKVQQAYEAAQAEVMARQPSSSETVASSQEASSSALSPTFSTQSAAKAMSPSFAIPTSTLEELQELHTRVEDLKRESETLNHETQRLQAEVEELQRMNNDLQEENENFLQLLNERMFAGVINDSGIGSSADSSSQSAYHL